MGVFELIVDLLTGSPGDWGEGNKDRLKRDAKATGVSTSEAAKAQHAARDDAAKEGGWGVPFDRHGSHGPHK